MNSIKNTLQKKLYNGYKAAAEKIIPDLKESKFIETGMLTKEEFKRSGDILISNDSAWCWNKPGVCLEKKHVYCNVIKLEIDDSGNSEDSDMNMYKLTDQTEKNANVNANIITNASDTIIHNETDEDCLDGFAENMDVYEDPIGVSAEAVKEGHYYDISITYDNYYRTPRIWFNGLNEYGEPLDDKSIYADFMVEYIKVSLTLEVHPVLNMNCISVHPCKHAFAMQKMFAFEMEKKDIDNIKVEDYLVHFLKFASCVIPQLEFDKSTT